MANAGNPKLKVFAEHGEKIALGVAALLLVGYLLSSLGNKVDATSQNLASWTKKVKEDLDSEHKELQPPKGGDQTRSALAPFSSKPPTPAADPWIASYPTRAEIRTTEKVVEREKSHVMPDPSNLRAEAELGLVKLSFDVTLVDVNKYIEAPLTKFVLERRKDGEAKWSPLATDLAPALRQYEDGKVDPNTTYFYRLTAFTSDTKTDNANRGGQGKVSVEVTVLSADIWKFTVLQAFPDEDVDTDQIGKGKAQIVITKFEKAANEKFTMTRTYDGDKKDVRLGFEAGKSTKDFTIGKGKFTVDFDCGLEIQAILPSKRSKPGRKAYDIVCVYTSNKKKKVLLPYPAEEEPKPTPTPDPKKKEEEATKAIEAADKLWETDKKAAGAKYAEILKTFADVEAVKKRKAEFEDRIKTAPK